MRHHARGVTICSICAGAFLLASTGLLDGRSATTHWIHADKLASDFPHIEVDTNRLLIYHGDVITAGGLMAWVDLALMLIGRFINPTLLVATARYFLVDAAGREQRFYSPFSPQQLHGDSTILTLQRWLPKHIADKLEIAQLASQINLGERTFQRRFQSATGMTPTRYIQTLRVSRGREALEGSPLSIEKIAAALGYEDVGAFRSIFKRLIGLSPADYRRRFGMVSH